MTTTGTRTEPSSKAEPAYEPAAVERRWQGRVAAAKPFAVVNPGEERAGVYHRPMGRGKRTANGRRSYVLEMLPYPSGSLHMGHVLVYTIGDVLTHFRRRKGFEVLRPMGFDSFGLPAENAAIKAGGHPKEITERNIRKIRSSMQRLGLAIDWSREISTHEPEYYRWTQSLFLTLLERDLIYRRQAPVKWCPNDQTVVANEQVKDGKCERCGTEVVAKQMPQWFMRTTHYADELLDFSGLDWPEQVVSAQKQWIGKSEGAEIDFATGVGTVTVFSTRPDTLGGVTFLALAPEHPLVAAVAQASANGDEIRAYVARAAAKRGQERAQATVKTGVLTGVVASHPISAAELPIYVADYVLMDYGTGAIMGVPGEDPRDAAFAAAYGLRVVPVVEEGRLVNSGDFDGMTPEDAQPAIVERLGAAERGRTATSYRLRDWGFSRQRYWGCPIPIVHCPDCGPVPVPESELPVLLPEVDDYRPKGEAPLAANEEWMCAPCPRCGQEGQREAETMDTFVDSSWYFLRYCDPKNDQQAFDPQIVDHWGPVDDYTGGMDHTTMHMIYARFFTKALADAGLLSFREPFTSFFGNGWVKKDGKKMAKRWGNVVDPDVVVARYGADTVRLYTMFMGPADQDMDWRDDGVEGMRRFVGRLWRAGELAAATTTSTAATPLTRKAHQTIAAVSRDIERKKFNTPIARVMELVNAVEAAPQDPGLRFAVETAVSLLQPYAPHVSEEIWARLGHREPLWDEAWPEADPQALVEDAVEIVVQVNGKVRDRFTVAAETPEAERLAQAKARDKVQMLIDGQPLKHERVIHGTLVTLAV